MCYEQGAGFDSHARNYSLVQQPFSLHADQALNSFFFPTAALGHPESERVITIKLQLTLEYMR